MPQTPVDADGQSSHDQSRNEVKNEPRPFLIYNKVSAVINESKSVTTPVDDKTPNEELDESLPAKESKVGNSVWYEYGCV